MTDWSNVTLAAVCALAVMGGYSVGCYWSQRGKQLGVGGPGVRPGQTGEGTPHREGSPGPVLAVDYREAVVSYDPEAGAAYIAVRPHGRVARTASVHPDDLVMLDYDEQGQLLGVEVLGIVRDKPTTKDQ